jgi:predicted RNA binding protein YcfA (HicA-like mRNA interferase family)
LEGFQRVKEEGDHLIYARRGVPRPVVIPRYAAVPVFVIKNNLRTAGLSRERYFEFLRK